MNIDLGKRVDLAPGPAQGVQPSPARSWALFSLAVPLLMALPLGWYGAGIGAEMSRTASLVLWGSVCLLSWWMSDGCARGLGWLLRRWRPAPALLWVAGYWVNMLLSSIYNPALVDALLRVGLVEPTPMLHAYFALDRNLLDPGYLWLLLLAGGPGFVVWVAGNVAYQRMSGRRHPAPASGAARGVPDVREAVQRDTGSPVALPRGDVAIDTDAPVDAAVTATGVRPAPPRFFQRLQRLAGLRAEELVAIEAEDHYVQVHTTRGKELVYVRFRDALEQLDGIPGLQIHRSAWVARRGVASLERRDRNLHVVLVTGERLRVSASNLGTLRDAGLSP